jgi:predicted MPP superfamily phosphohydrolase
LVVFGRYIEPQWIQVTQHDVEMPGLPSSLDGFKVVQISDIHRGSRTKDITIEKAVRLANEPITWLSTARSCIRTKAGFT